MSKLTVKDDHLTDRVGFGDTNEEMGKLSEAEAWDYLKIGYDGKDKSIINKFVDPPSADEVAARFDKKVLDKTAAKPQEVKTPEKPEAQKADPGK